ncbi:hypothetical protein CCUS01_08049 [Colletotrichum cuscutae]|uniref:Uncharacterized protein n=1 Tax=Colletotrichum cuscutae TaxID=1209917 RepID=A0AAI9UVL6_9PEZI|nr:hypothetical protein CCUS01_08049 [Colletotrichum cuscutae]
MEPKARTTLVGKWEENQPHLPSNLDNSLTCPYAGRMPPQPSHAAPVKAAIIPSKKGTRLGPSATNHIAALYDPGRFCDPTRNSIGEEPQETGESPRGEEGLCSIPNFLLPYASQHGKGVTSMRKVWQLVASDAGDHL